ncbi:MAG: hypothetical protein GY938_27120 [Ketobacter sp.]|nr:hypothetical protein [Ketobacter sp.]
MKTVTNPSNDVLDGIVTQFNAEQNSGAVSKPDTEKEQPVEQETAAKAPQVEYQFEEPEMLSGWEFKPWKHRLLMELYETGVLKIGKEWDGRFRRNHETVKAVIEAGGFNLPTAATVEMLDDLEWYQVEQLYTAVWTNYYNCMFTKKN